MAWKPVKSGGAALVLAVLVATGCRSPSDLNPVAGPRAALPAPRPALARAPAVPSPIRQVAHEEAGAGTLPTPEVVCPPVAAPLHLGLAAAIEAGLSRNPDLLTLRGTEGVSRSVVGVARTIPFNPTVQTRILPYDKFQGGGNAATYNYVLLWQQFEIANQRRFRTQNAAAALDGVRWTIHQAELQNVALTEQLYFTALYQRGLRDLAVQAARLNEEVREVTERRARAGGASAADAATARLDARSMQQQARLAAVGFENAVLALRRQLNLPPDVPLELEGDLTQFAWHPVSGAELCRLLGDGSVYTEETPPEALADELAARRPDVLAAHANRTAARANLGLAQASRVPNLWLGPFYSRDSEAIVSVGFQAQMDIPVVNTGKPLVRQREAELHQQANAATQLEARARVEARTALARYERARSLSDQTRAEAGQQTPAELEQLEAAFRRGEIDIVRITQSRNSLLQLRRTYLDSLNEVALAAAALTAATGLPPAALVSCQPEAPATPSPAPAPLPASPAAPAAFKVPGQKE